MLVPGGVLHAAANGSGHLRQLNELVGDDWDLTRLGDLFGLESGPAQLDAFFVDLRAEPMESGLEVTEIEPLVAYVASSGTFRGDLDRVRRGAEEVFARDGVFRIESHPGVLHARKP